MNHSILALRLALREAFAPHGAGDAGPWPTLAQNRVFDSRLDMVDARAKERTPIIIFGFEDFDGDAFSGQNGAHNQGGPRGYDGTARLVISMQVTSRETVTWLNENREPQTGEEEVAALLDWELTDVLATLGEQVELVLRSDPLIGKLTRRCDKISLAPYADPDTGEKIAIVAASYQIQPLTDGAKALALALGYLPPESSGWARATAATTQIAQTAAFLDAARLARSGLPAQPVPFAATVTAQGVVVVPPASVPPTPVPATGVAVTLDPPL